MKEKTTAAAIEIKREQRLARIEKRKEEKKDTPVRKKPKSTASQEGTKKEVTEVRRISRTLTKVTYPPTHEEKIKRSSHKLGAVEKNDIEDSTNASTNQVQLRVVDRTVTEDESGKELVTYTLSDGRLVDEALMHGIFKKNTNEVIGDWIDGSFDETNPFEEWRSSAVSSLMRHQTSSNTYVMQLTKKQVVTFYHYNQRFKAVGLQGKAPFSQLLSIIESGPENTDITVNYAWGMSDRKDDAAAEQDQSLSTLRNLLDHPDQITSESDERMSILYQNLNSIESAERSLTCYKALSLALCGSELKRIRKRIIESGTAASIAKMEARMVIHRITNFEQMSGPSKWYSFHSDRLLIIT